jgi:hypothetical protein
MVTDMALLSAQESPSPVPREAIVANLVLQILPGNYYLQRAKDSAVHLFNLIYVFLVVNGAGIAQSI